MTTRATLLLACRQCGWVPPDQLELGVVRAHMETEHGAEPDTDNIEMDLRAYCPRDMTYMGEPYHQEIQRNGTTVDHYNCHECRRDYVVKRGA